MWPSSCPQGKEKALLCEVKYHKICFSDLKNKITKMLAPNNEKNPPTIKNESETKIHNESETKAPLPEVFVFPETGGSPVRPTSPIPYSNYSLNASLPTSECSSPGGRLPVRSPLSATKSVDGHSCSDGVVKESPVVMRRRAMLSSAQHRHSCYEKGWYGKFSL